MGLDSGCDIGGEYSQYSTIQNRLGPIPLEGLDTDMYTHKHLKMLIQCKRLNEVDFGSMNKSGLNHSIKGN